MCVCISFRMVSFYFVVVLLSLIFFSRYFGRCSLQMHHHVPRSDMVEIKDHEISIPNPKPRELQEFQSFWNRGNNLPIYPMDARLFAYGCTATTGTLWKQWMTIRKFVIITKTDVLAAPGDFSRIVLSSKLFFSPFPDMRATEDWTTATIVITYDGAPNAWQEPHQRAFM